MAAGCNLDPTPGGRRDGDDVGVSELGRSCMCVRARADLSPRFLPCSVGWLDET